MWRRLSENMQISSTWLDGSRATARSVHEAIPLFVLNRPPGTSARRAFSLTELTTTRIPSLTRHLVSIIRRYFFSPEIGKWNDSVCAGPSGLQNWPLTYVRRYEQILFTLGALE